MNIGQRVTLLRINDWSAMTCRYELEVRQPLEPTQVGYDQRDTRLAVVRQRGKRKQQYLDVKPDDILFDGWDVPFYTDTEREGIMAGNACFNLIGDPAVIRTWVETCTLRPVTDDAKAKIVVSRAPRAKCDDSECELLYPNIDTHHAVVRRMKMADEPTVIG